MCFVEIMCGRKNSWKFGIFCVREVNLWGWVEVGAMLQTECRRETVTLKERQEMLFSRVFNFQE